MWEVLPTKAGAISVEMRTRASLQETAFANGWLCFESATSKKRLAPIPDGWETVETRTLCELCVRATDVPPRRRRTVSA